MRADEGPTGAVGRLRLRRGSGPDGGRRGHCLGDHRPEGDRGYGRGTPPSLRTFGLPRPGLRESPASDRLWADDLTAVYRGTNDRDPRPGTGREAVVVRH